nr:MAG TPA_asm: Adenylylsulfate kinase [Caudoviricetes sp.]
MGQSECGKSTYKKEIKRLLKLNYAKKIKYPKKNFVHHRRFYNFVVSNKSTRSLTRLFRSPERAFFMPNRFFGIRYKCIVPCIRCNGVCVLFVEAFDKG